MHSALGSGSQRVGNAFRFGEPWVRFREGFTVLSSSNLMWEIRLSVKLQRVIEYDVEQCFQTAGMSARIRTNIYFRKIKINI